MRFSFTNKQPTDAAYQTLVSIVAQELPGSLYGKYIFTKDVSDLGWTFNAHFSIDGSKVVNCFET